MDRPDDISGLWKTAMDKYAEMTGDNLFTQSDPNSRTIDSVLAFTTENQKGFEMWRHNKGKISKLRTALKKCLGALDGLATFIAPYVSGVGN